MGGGREGSVGGSGVVGREGGWGEDAGVAIETVRADALVKILGFWVLLLGLLGLLRLSQNTGREEGGGGGEGEEGKERM